MLFFSTSGSTGITDIPDILAQTEHGCRVLIDGHALREVLNSVDTYDAKLDLVQDLIRQVGAFVIKIAEFRMYRISAHLRSNGFERRLKLKHHIKRGCGDVSVYLAHIRIIGKSLDGNWNFELQTPYLGSDSQNSLFR